MIYDLNDSRLTAIHELRQLLLAALLVVVFFIFMAIRGTS